MVASGLRSRLSLGAEVKCRTDCSLEQVPCCPRPLLVGVLPGEGIGSEVTACALQVLQEVATASGLELQIETGGPIGRQSEATHGSALTDEVVDFCEQIFGREGATLNGPGGGRYVYDLRRRFDLFLKISPLRAEVALPEAAKIKASELQGLDILVTRENSGGIYQGEWQDYTSDGQAASHRFEYSAWQVERFLDASAKLAARRRGKMTVVWKESGIPSISRLWRDVAEKAATEYRVEFSMVDADLMAYRLIQEPLSFDVIATPNLFGDLIGDLGAVLLGSRGLSFSGNYNADGHAVYQTNHGAAYDLAGTDRANPVGQILSMAMMLRESFGLLHEANAVEEAVRRTWQEGWRTADVATPGSRIIGTQEMASRIAERVTQYEQTKVAAQQVGILP